ncbi:MAG: ATP-binding region ATPase domain protein [Gemmatimonadetes bacterium]|nr:ATP-binding region ATPase domain protein [Gemmatimonadota bacterium]
MTLVPGDDLHRLLVESVADYAIFALDREGRVVTWNTGAERIKGYRADEIIGQHFSRFYPKSDIDAGKPAFELEEASRVGRFEDEGWRLRKDGTRVWANVVITALRDKQGELVGFAKVTRDLTKRVEGEAQARQLAAEAAAREAAESQAEELRHLNEQLQYQATELEVQTEEAQSLAEELEQTNEQLQDALTASEEAQEASANAERYTRGILDSIADPFVVQDRDWRFQFVNAQAAEIFARSGRPVDTSIIGRVVWEEYPEMIGTAFEREMRRAAESRQPSQFEAFDPTRGEWSLLHCYPLPDGGLATQWQGITERKRSEESARYLARASEILGSSLDYDVTLAELARVVVPELADWCAIEVVDDEGVARQVAVAHVDPAKVEFANQLRERYPPDPNANTGVPQVLRTGEPEMFSEIPDELLVAGAVDAEHLRIIRELGLRSAMTVPLVARGRVLGALTLVAAESGRRYHEADLALALELARRAALSVDNARLHRAELEARRAAENANRAKGEFLTNMSHELRTPLNAIGGHVQLLEMGLHGPVTPDQKAALERVSLAQRHLLHLINDLLNLARIEHGKIDYVIAPVLLREVLGPLSSLVGPQFAARQISFVVELPEDHGELPIEVLADREKLIQVLTNLLGNAVKFTPAGGSTRLVLRDGDVEGMAVIQVIDTGPGIPADKVESVFEPFVQLDRSLSALVEGTGLGLAISRDLARGMGGDLRAEAVKGGATLTLTLRRV